jgi:hypothetical protein
MGIGNAEMSGGRINRLGDRKDEARLPRFEKIRGASHFGEHWQSGAVKIEP